MKIQLAFGSVRFFALLVPEVLFNNGVKSLDEALFVLGKLLNIGENLFFFFTDSVIFLNANNVSEGFVFVITRNREIIAGYGMKETSSGIRKTKFGTCERRKRYQFAMF